MQWFDSACLPRQPWHNGGGTTREIVCHPAGASMQDFDWRISIADVARDGPFSVLPGVDRTIVLMQGPGLRLRRRCGRLDHRLDSPGVPLRFDGGLQVDAEMLGGPSEDFNVMTRAGRCRAQIELLQGTVATGPSAQGLVLVLQGRWSMHADPAVAPGVSDAASTAAAPGPATTPATAPVTALTAGQGLWWLDGPLPYPLQPHHPGARLLRVLIEPADGAAA